MKVLHVLSQRPGLSGSGVFLNAMVRESARRGLDQHVIIAGPAGTEADQVPGLDPGRCTVIGFPSERAPFPVPGNSDVMPYPSTVFSQMTALQLDQYLAVTRDALQQVRDEFEPDIVHCHHLWIMTSLAREVCADRPVIATAHNSEIRQMKKAPHLAPMVLREIGRLDRIGVLTPRSMSDTVEVFGVEPCRVRVTGAGFNQDLFYPRNLARGKILETLRRQYGVELETSNSELNGPIITFAGRLSTPKGIPYLLDAFGELSSEGRPGLRLALIGGLGPAETELARKLQRVPANVIQTGVIPQEAVALILNCSDLFVLPSMFEGLPLVMMEAAACGCPCIVTNLPTVSSWVQENCTRRDWVSLVPLPPLRDADQPEPSAVPEFVRNLAAAIRMRLANPMPDWERQRLADQMKLHSWSSVFEKYLGIYRDLVGN